MSPKRHSGHVQLDVDLIPRYEALAERSGVSLNRLVNSLARQQVQKLEEQFQVNPEAKINIG